MRGHATSPTPSCPVYAAWNNAMMYFSRGTWLALLRLKVMVGGFVTVTVWTPAPVGVLVTSAESTLAASPALGVSVPFAVALTLSATLPPPGAGAAVLLLEATPSSSSFSSFSSRGGAGAVAVAAPSSHSTAPSSHVLSFQNSRTVVKPLGSPIRMYVHFLMCAHFM